MMKRMLLALAATATIATMGFTAAPAQAAFYVYGGVPYYGYPAAPTWRYYYGRGWYDPYKYSYVQPYKMNCAQARQAVRDYGFNKITTLDCSGKVYNFTAWKNGRQKYVSVNSWTGEVWKN